MSAEAFDRELVGTSKFYMIRCLIAMAHADGIVCDAERAYISALTNRLPLTDEQRRTIEHDLEHEQPVDYLLRHINEPKYRGQLPYFARLMAYKDGVLHPDEELLLQKMHAYAVDGLDMNAIRKEVQTAVQAEMMLHDIRVHGNRPMKGDHAIPWLQWLDEILLYLGIDLLGG
jgi:hypothetical protein